MLFSSVSFLFVFLPLVLGLYYLVPGRGKNAVLLLGSILFYAAGEPVYLLLLLFSAFVGWVHGLYMTAHPGKKWALCSSVLWNLVFLVFFKYADLLITSVNGLLGTAIPVLKLGLPIGISFYTFQNMSYCLDVYRGDYKAEKNFASYATYLCLFPQLIAGPIVRYSDVARDLNARTLTLDGVSRGALRFTLGLGKKVLLANPMGQLAELGEGGSVLMVWLKALAFALQLYLDFSAYSDMAIGLGAMMGFTFPENFDYPYLSRSVTEFWRRWHMTLGGWFRDYVYIPLGGSRCSRGKWIRNVLVVWMLTGIWHGASWNFMLWGLYYGILLLVEKLWLKKYLTGRVFPHVYLLLLTIFGFVLFNSPTAGQALGTIGSMVGLGGLPLADPMGVYYLRSYAVLLVLAVIGSTPWPRKWALQVGETKAGAVLEPLLVLGLLILVTACLVDGSFNPFLYFRF